MSGCCTVCGCDDADKYGLCPLCESYLPGQAYAPRLRCLGCEPKTFAEYVRRRAYMRRQAQQKRRHK